MVPLAIGSQTNGSVIRPAAFCGVYGVKPTHGIISRRGALILSQALDHVGVFARTLADAALILEVLAGYDPERQRHAPAGGAALPRDADRGAADAAAARLRAHAGLGQGRRRDARGIRGFRQAAGRFRRRRRSAGQLMRQPGTISAPSWPPTWRTIWARWSSAAAMPPASNCAISWPRAAQVSAVRYLAARDAARRYAAGITEIFKEYDAILTPATHRRRPQGHGHRQPGVLLAVVADRPAGAVAAAVERGGRHAARRATRRTSRRRRTAAAHGELADQ